MPAYYEPKSIAPILQESARAQVPFLSQPAGLSQALPALGGVAQAGFGAMEARAKRQSLLEAQQGYSQYLAKVDAGTATPQDHAIGRMYGMSLGIEQKPAELADPRLVSSMQEGLGIQGAPIKPTKANVSGLESAMKMKEARDARRTAAEERINSRKQPVPPGYRLTKNGNLEAIPGGPAFRKEEMASEKESTAQNAALEQADLVMSKVDQALAKVSARSTGIGAATIGQLPGSQARDLQGDLDTIKANLGFATLAEMKRASPTGGALGAISESEMRLLTSARASLDTAQSAEQIRQHLTEIKTHFSKWKDAVMKSRQDGGSSVPGVVSAPAVKSDPLGLFK